MSSSLLLSDDWDLSVDSSGNIATTSGDEALAQDVATAIRTFSGDCYFDTSLGIPYFAQILGQYPSLSLVKRYFNDTALSIDGVESATTYLVDYTGRTFTGQVQVKTSDNTTLGIGF